MNKTENFEFNLPNRDNPDEIADINVISENFEKADEILKEHEIRTNELSFVAKKGLYYKYDFNGDGEVNEEDVHRLLYCVNFSQAPEYRPSWWSDPDVNGDGVVGDEDVATLQNWLETGNEAAYAIAPKNELVDDHFSATSEKPIRNKAVSAGAANALKGTASGTVVAMKDVSPLEHPIGVKLSSDTITNFSSVTLKKYGKNLIDFKKAFYRNNSIKLSYTDNGIIIPAGFSFYFAIPCNIKAGQTVTFNCESEGKEKLGSYTLYHADETTNKQAYIGEYVKVDFDVAYIYVYKQSASTATTEEMRVTNLQLELGTTASEYEPYKEPETVPVKQDGTASIIGKGEGITLMTDTEGVTITAEYNRDVNKALADLEAKLQALILEV